MPPALDLRSQAFTPSNHLCSTFLLPAPPQFLNQAPPGAQQLTRPDFSNVPHFGQLIVLAIVEVTAGVLTDVVIGVCSISSRSGNGWRVTYSRVVRVVAGVGAVLLLLLLLLLLLVAAALMVMPAVVVVVRHIDPREPRNILSCRAFE